MPRSSRQTAFGALLALLATFTCKAHEESKCDIYSVELQAKFQDDVLIPCTKEETTIIETLIHSLVQTDAIVGLNRLIPVPPFFLAYEEFGSGVTRSYEEVHFESTQLELAKLHLTTADRIEDMYYACEYNESLADHLGKNNSKPSYNDTYNATNGHDSNNNNTHHQMNHNNSSDTKYHYNNSSNANHTSYHVNASGTPWDQKADPAGPPKNVGNDEKIVPPPLVIEEDSLRRGRPTGDDHKDKDEDQRQLDVMPLPGNRDTTSPTQASTSMPNSESGLRGTPGPTLASSELTPAPTPIPSPDTTQAATSTSSPTTQQSSSTTDKPAATTYSPTSGLAYEPTSPPTPASSPGLTPTLAPTSIQTAEFTSAPTTSTLSPTSDHTHGPTFSNPTMPTDGNCEGDWCATFLTRPCENIPHDEKLESTKKFQMALKQFEARVEEQILLKLRKWARDTNTMCLGNSWKLNAVVKRML